MSKVATYVPHGGVMWVTLPVACKRGEERRKR